MKLRLRLDSGMSSKPTVSLVKKHTCRCDTSSAETPNGCAQPRAKRCQLGPHSHLISESPNRLDSCNTRTRKTLPHALRLCTNTRNTVTPTTQSMVLRQRPTRTMCASLWHKSKRNIKTVSFHFVNVHVRSCGNIFFFSQNWDRETPTFSYLSGTQRAE